MAEKEVFDFDQVKMPNLSPNVIKYGLIGILALIFIFSSVFTISPEEVGVILRFGKFSHIADPGLNFKLPLGIDKLYKVAVQRQLKEEFGFRTEEPGIRTRYSTANFLDESLMLRKSNGSYSTAFPILTNTCLKYGGHNPLSGQ